MQKTVCSISIPCVHLAILVKDERKHLFYFSKDFNGQLFCRIHSPWWLLLKLKNSCYKKSQVCAHKVYHTCKDNPCKRPSAVCNFSCIGIHICLFLFAGIFVFSDRLLFVLIASAYNFADNGLKITSNIFCYFVFKSKQEVGVDCKRLHAEPPPQSLVAIILVKVDI